MGYLARFVVAALVAYLTIHLLAACGTSGTDTGTGRDVAQSYVVGGAIVGLTGAGLVIQNNGGDSLTDPDFKSVDARRHSFTFPTPIPRGGTYSVSVQTMPSDQVCIVGVDGKPETYSGTVEVDNVTNIEVTCEPDKSAHATIDPTGQDISRTTEITVNFDKPVRIDTVTGDTFFLTRQNDTNKVDATLSVSNKTGDGLHAKTFTLTLKRPLVLLNTYDVVLTKGIIRDQDGNLFSGKRSSFTTADGEWIGSETIGGGVGTQLAYNQEIAINQNGDAIAVWQQAEASNSITKTWARRYKVGSGWETAALKISDDSAESIVFPRIAINQNGDAMAVWEQQGTAGKRLIWSRRFLATAASWDKAAPIEVDGAGFSHSSQVAIDQNGNAIAVWIKQDATRLRILSSRFSSKSGTWGKAETIDGPSAGFYADYPQIGIDKNGDAIAVWVQTKSSQLGDNRIGVNRFTNSEAGGSWGTSFWLDQNDTGWAGAPQLAMNDNGDAMLVWIRYNGNPPAPTNVRTSRFTASTGKWGDLKMADANNEPGADAMAARVAIDQNANAIVVWSQTTTKNGATKHGIQANRFTVNSGNWGDVVWLEESNSYAPSGAKISVDHSGNGIAVWSGREGTRARIRAQRFTGGSWKTATTWLDGIASVDVRVPEVAIDTKSNCAISVWIEKWQIQANRFE